MILNRTLAFSCYDNNIFNTGFNSFFNYVLMVGLSTIGSISFGIAFVAGRKRVPKPAAGIMALRTFFI